MLPSLGPQVGKDILAVVLGGAFDPIAPYNAGCRLAEALPGARDGAQVEAASTASVLISVPSVTVYPARPRPQMADTLLRR